MADVFHGEDGLDGREVELQRGETHVQWRYRGTAKWKDLIELAHLKGADGRDADPATVEALVKAAVDSIPKPADGKSVTAAEVIPLLAELFAALPAPQNGRDGKDGRDGRDGVPAKRMPWRMYPVRDKATNLIIYVDLVPIEE